MVENNELEILQHEPVPNKAVLQKWLELERECVCITSDQLTLHCVTFALMDL
jgi:hypothetical protein